MPQIMARYNCLYKDVKFFSNIILDSATGQTLNDKLASKLSYTINQGLNLNQIKCDVLVPETRSFVVIGSDTSIAGVLNVTNDLNVDGINILDQLNLKANTSQTLQKDVSGIETFINIDSKTRIVTGTDGHFKIQYFDSDGTIITDSWLDMGIFYFDTNSNIGGLMVDYIKATRVKRYNY